MDEGGTSDSLDVGDVEEEGEEEEETDEEEEEEAEAEEEEEVAASLVLVVIVPRAVSGVGEAAGGDTPRSPLVRTGPPSSRGASESSES